MLKRLWTSLFSNEIYRNSTKLFLGHAASQTLVFLSGPILSRLYSPSEFGHYALLSSIAGTISIISTGCYEVASLTVKQEKEANILSLLSIFLSFATSIVSAIILSLLFIKSGAWKESILDAGWGLVPLFVFIQGVYNTTNYTLNRQKKYNTMSLSKGIRSAFMIPLQILFGIKDIFSGLYLGMLAGHLTGMAFQMKDSITGYISTFHKTNTTEALKTAKTNYKFPLFFMPEQLINSVSAHAPVFFLTIFFTENIVGLFSLPRRFLSAPIVLIGNSLGQIYFRDASFNRNNKQELAKTTASLFRFLFRLGVIPFSFLIIFGDIAVQFTFGTGWELSGLYTMILSPYLFMLLLGSPLSNIFAVTGKQKLSMLISIYLFVARVIAFLVGTFVFKSATISIILFSIVSFAFWFLTAFYNLHLSYNKIWPLFKEFFFLWFGILIIMLLFRIQFLN
jgi:O-antigen/teichoic acid export membrane protein